MDTVKVMAPNSYVTHRQMKGRAEYTGNSFKSWDDIHDDHKSIPEDGTKVVTANVQGIGMWASLPGNRRDPRRAGARRGSLNR